MKQNKQGEHIVQHHVKYKEIHGVDEIVLMPASEHVELHRKLRQKGKCKVPVDELKKISSNASVRTRCKDRKKVPLEEKLDKLFTSGMSNAKKIYLDKLK